MVIQIWVKRKFLFSKHVQPSGKYICMLCLTFIRVQAQGTRLKSSCRSRLRDHRCQRSVLGAQATYSEAWHSKRSGTCQRKNRWNSPTRSGRRSELEEKQEAKLQRWVETVHLGVLILPWRLWETAEEFQTSTAAPFWEPLLLQRLDGWVKGQGQLSSSKGNGTKDGSQQEDRDGSKFPGQSTQQVFIQGERLQFCIPCPHVISPLKT